MSLKAREAVAAKNLATRLSPRRNLGSETYRFGDAAVTLTLTYFDAARACSSPEWSVDGVMGSTNFVRDLWLPDIQGHAVCDHKHFLN